MEQALGVHTKVQLSGSGAAVENWVLFLLPGVHGLQCLVNCVTLNSHILIRQPMTSNCWFMVLNWWQQVRSCEADCIAQIQRRQGHSVAQMSRWQGSSWEMPRWQGRGSYVPRLQCWNPAPCAPQASALSPSTRTSASAWGAQGVVFLMMGLINYSLVWRLHTSFPSSMSFMFLSRSKLHKSKAYPSIPWVLIYPWNKGAPWAPQAPVCMRVLGELPYSMDIFQGNPCSKPDALIHAMLCSHPCYAIPDVSEYTCYAMLKAFVPWYVILDVSEYTCWFNSEKIGDDHWMDY